AGHRSTAFVCLLGLLPVISGVLTGQQRTPARYPAHWWAPVPKEGAPDWEILPQEAGPGEVILSKRHELGLLSNFAATPFTFRGQRYASLEGFWQMMKYPETNANPPAGFPGLESKLTPADDPRAKFPGVEWRYTREQVAQFTAF